MRRFVLRVCLGAAISVACCFSILAVRICAAQRTAEKVLEVRDDTEILCVGNSHTGCTWYEVPDFHVQKMWMSGTRTHVALVHLLEIERRNGFKNVKKIVVDFDTAGLRYEVDQIERAVMEQLPIIWRYPEWIPLPYADALCLAGTQLGYRWVLASKNEDHVRKVEVSFNERQEEDRRRVFESECDFWGPRTKRCKNWEEFEKGVVRELKALCLRQNLELVLFASPLHSKGLDYPRSGQDRLSGWVEFLKKECITFYDLRKVCSDNDFIDLNHLLPSRRESMTKKFFSGEFEHLKVSP